MRPAKEPESSATGSVGANGKSCRGARGGRSAKQGEYLAAPSAKVERLPPEQLSGLPDLSAGDHG